MMAVSQVKKTIRRSVALPNQLLEELAGVCPDELRANFNRLVIVALKTYAAECRARAFADSMARMAQDPDIQRECALINKEFLPTEADGLHLLG